jgi:hypothetical protein
MANILKPSDEIVVTVAGVAVVVAVFAKEGYKKAVISGRKPRKVKYI